MKQEEYVKKRTIKKSLIIAIIALIFIVILVGVYILIFNYDKVSYEDHEMYLYIGDRKYDFNGTITVSNKKGVTNIKSDTENIIITGNPIYFERESTWAMIPNDMVYVDLKDKTNLYKLSHYSIIKSDGIAAKISIDGKYEVVDPCLLYDGNDLYLFPYNTEVTIDGTTYNLKGNSYVIVNYHDSVEIFNKDGNKYTYIETHNEDAMADIMGYTINLDTDIVMDNSGSRLLMKDIEVLKEYK